MGKKIDLTGQRFGRLTVLRKAVSRKGKQIRWLCQCDCGKLSIVGGSSLRMMSEETLDKKYPYTYKPW